MKVNENSTCHTQYYILALVLEQWTRNLAFKLIVFREHFNFVY